MRTLNHPPPAAARLRNLLDQLLMIALPKELKFSAITTNAGVAADDVVAIVVCKPPGGLVWLEYERDGGARSG